VRKVLSDFYVSSVYKGGHGIQCKACLAEGRRKSKEKHHPSHGPVVDLPGEEWRVWSVNPVYAVSDMGRVKRVVPYIGPTGGEIFGEDGGLIKGYFKSDRGRVKYVGIKKSSSFIGCPIAPMVLEAFIGRCKRGRNRYIRKDGDEANDRLENLEWEPKAVPQKKLLPETAKCERCNEVKSISLFWNNGTVSDWCKGCAEVDPEGWIEKKKERRKQSKRHQKRRKREKLKRDRMVKETQGKALWEKGHPGLVWCITCGLPKDKEEMRTIRQNSWSGQCKICAKKTRGKWYTEKLPEKMKDPEFAKRRIENIKKSGRKAYRKKMKTIEGQLNARMRYRVRDCLRRGYKSGSWTTLVDYSVNQLKRRLRRTMPEGYSWDDFMDGDLHIDHIIPLSAFPFTSDRELNFKKAWALKNLQLLPARDNMVKGVTIEGSVQLGLPISQR